MIGADPGDANLVKLLGNMMSATALEMLGEVVAVIRKRGTGPAAIHRHHDEHDVRRTRAQNLWRQDRKSDLCARVCLAARAQGRASGARGSGEGGRADAFGWRRPGSADHGYRSWLWRTRLDRPRACRRGGSGALRHAAPSAANKPGPAIARLPQDHAFKERTRSWTTKQTLPK